MIVFESAQVLFPICSIKMLQLWAENYLRFDEIMYRRSTAFDEKDEKSSSVLVNLSL